MSKFTFLSDGYKKCDYCHRTILTDEQCHQWEDEEAVYCDNCINKIT